MDSIYLILFIIVSLILASLVLGMWFVLSTRVKSANEQVMKTSTHIDEQVQSLANLTSMTYAPIVSVEDIARDLHEINQTLLDKTENLKNSLTFTNEETKQKYMKNLAEVNQFSQDYATKAMAVKTDLDKRMLNVEDNTQTWQQNQNQIYTDFVKKQQDVLKKNQEITDKVFKTEQDLLRDSREIKKTMHYVADETSVLNNFTIKTREDMNTRINEYSANLNKLYNKNLGKVSDIMNKNDFLVKTNINRLNVDLRTEQSRLDRVNNKIQDVQAMQANILAHHKKLMDYYQKTADDVFKTENVVIKESNEAKMLMHDVMEETASLRNFTMKTKANLEDNINTSSKNARDFTMKTKANLEDNINTSSKNARDFTMENIKTTNATMQSEINRVLVNIKKNDEEMRAIQTANIALFKGLIAQQAAIIENVKQTTESQFKANDIAIKAKINDIIQAQTVNYNKLIALISEQTNNFTKLGKALENNINDFKATANKKLGDHDVYLSSLSSKIDNVQKNLNTTASNINSRLKTYEKLNSDLSTDYNRRIDEANNRISSVNTVLYNDYEQKFATANIRIDEANNKISSVNKGLYNDYEQKFATANRRIDEANNKISSVNQGLYNGYDSRINEINVRLNSHYQIIDQLSKTINSAFIV